MFSTSRRRAKADEAYPSENDSVLENSRKSNFRLSYKFWLASIAALVLLFTSVDIVYHVYPVTGELSNAESASGDTLVFPNKFSEANVRALLDQVCRYGTRHVGSHANEVIAPEKITEIVRATQKNANPVHKVELVSQLASGCFDIDFIGGFTSCYANVTNILVRLSSTLTSQTSAVLVNCHYDSSISSPGASDDLVSCGIMLEVLRIISLTDVPFQHAIILILNGAEESVLQASHGFITQHPWAKQVKAFINLEAAGSGGREMVFQTGPEHPWLIKSYAVSAKHPFGSVVGQEIFQSGVIPSDTDFRIYRDYGKIPGIDIAYVYNGYIYHTKYDKPEYITEGSIQRAGENVLGLVMHIANSDQLKDPGEDHLGKMIFFDLLGYAMICYPEKLGRLINIAVVAAYLLTVYRTVKKLRTQGKSFILYAKLVSSSCVLHGLGFLVMIILNVLIALVITAIRPMMWYTNNWLIFPVYILPAVSVWLMFHQRGKCFFSRLFKLVSVWDLEKIFFESGLLFWALLLAVMTAMDLASSYVCMLLLVFPLLIRQIPVEYFDIKMHSSPKLYMGLTALSLLLPYLHIMQMIHMLMIFFIPLMGRMGSEVKPDLIIAIIALLPVIVFSIYQAGLLHISEDQRPLASRLLVASFIFVVIGCFTNIGFPYNENIDSPSCQRHVLHHYSREFYAFNGSLEAADHGMLYLPFDYNGAKYVDHVSEMSNMKLQNHDENAAYGGWPYYYPLLTLLSKVYIWEAPKPDLSNNFEIAHRKEQLSSDVIRYYFSSSGQQVHLNIYIALKDNAQLIAWSFTDGEPIPTKMPKYFTRKHYFVYTTSAKEPMPNRNFWIDVKLPGKSATSRPWVDIGFAAHYLDGPDSLTSELETVLAEFPSWAVPIGWSVTYKHYRL